MAAVIAVALIILLAALWVTGSGPFARNHTIPPTHVSVGPTFGEASAAVLTYAGSTGPGPWSIAFGIGAEMSDPLQVGWYWEGLSFHLGQVLCSFVAGSPSFWNSIIPAFDGPISSGESPGWIIVATNGTERGIVVLDLVGQPELLGNFGGGSCEQYQTPLGIVPAGLPDSAQATSLALGAGGASFLQSQPRSNATMWAPVPDPHSIGSGWVISFSTCPILIVTANPPNWTQITPPPTFAAFVEWGVGGPTVQDISQEEGCSLHVVVLT